MKREELKEELRLRNLGLSGNKAQLLSRLKEELRNKVPIANTNISNTNKSTAPKTDKKTKKSTGLASFAEGACQHSLTPDVYPVTEPNNPTFKKSRTPEIPEKDENEIPVKHNFSNNKFKLPAFHDTVS